MIYLTVKIRKKYSKVRYGKPPEGIWVQSIFNLIYKKNIPCSLFTKFQFLSIHPESNLQLSFGSGPISKIGSGYDPPDKSDPSP